MTSFKVGCKTRGDREQAQDYAEDLYARWTALELYTIHESADAPNRGLDAPTPGTLH